MWNTFLLLFLLLEINDSQKPWIKSIELIVEDRLNCWGNAWFRLNFHNIIKTVHFSLKPSQFYWINTKNYIGNVKFNFLGYLEFIWCVFVKDRKNISLKIRVSCTKTKRQNLWCFCYIKSKQNESKYIWKSYQRDWITQLILVQNNNNKKNQQTFTSLPLKLNLAELPSQTFHFLSYICY